MATTGHVFGVLPRKEELRPKLAHSLALAEVCEATRRHEPDGSRARDCLQQLQGRLGDTSNAVTVDEIWGGQRPSSTP